MPNTLLRDKFLTHLRRVETLADAGIPPPKAWQLLCDRHTKFRYMELPACDQLVAAILNPSKGADVVLLHSLALAEQANPGQQANVDNAVAHAVETRLLGRRTQLRPSRRPLQHRRASVHRRRGHH